MKWWQIRKRDADLERELRSDLELEEEEQREGGISGEEARHAALRAFGNPALIREQTRATWSWNWLESLARDLRLSLRTLRRTPGFTVIAILVMALGIGANVALFTVVRGVLLKPLPFQDPDRLVMLYEAGSLGDHTTDTNVISGGMYAEWKKQNRSYSSLALAQDIRVGLSGSGGQLPEKLKSALFSWDMLRTMGVQPALGRDFTQADDSPTANGTVLLSWGLWKRRFGGDPAILNQTIELDAAPYTVNEVIISQSFASEYCPGEDPLGKHLHVHGQNAFIVGIVGDTRYAIGETPRPVQYFSLDAGVENVGTLVIRSSQHPEQFALPVQRIVSEMDRDLPIFDVLTMNQLLGKSTQDQSFNTTLLVAFGSLSLVLAAVGLFGVMSYIGAQRTTEIGIRIALGAQREQVMRKMLLDGMRPAVFGLVVGLAANLEGGRLMRDLLYEIKPLDPEVFAAVAATLLAVAAFACIVPAWRAARLDPVQALRAE